MRELGYLLLLFNFWLRVSAFAAPTNSCSVAIQQLLHQTVPEFKKEEKSLTLEIGELLKSLNIILTFATFQTQTHFLMSVALELSL